MHGGTHGKYKHILLDIGGKVNIKLFRILSTPRPTQPKNSKTMTQRRRSASIHPCLIHPWKTLRSPRPSLCHAPSSSPETPPSNRHRWELPGNYPVFTVVMVIYHYLERIWIILVTPNFLYNIYNH